MNVGIIGCGLLGKKRAGSLGEHRLSICADLNFERARAMADLQSGAVATVNWRDVAQSTVVNLVIVSATPDQLAEIAQACLEAGKDVLVEKPAGINAAELRALAARAQHLGRKVRVGFNHRFHPAMQKAAAMIEDGAVGELMYIRGRYGHGGRLGYDKEWRADRAIAGGGELIDQGFHLIDLARWYLNREIVHVSGSVHTYFWNMAVEDNAFMHLRTQAGQTAFLHVSWTEWKNLFSFEIFGKLGKLQIDGLGGSYGLEQLTHYAMSAEMGPPATAVWQFPQVDKSFDAEFAAFVDDLTIGVDRGPGLDDAIAAFDIAETLYKQSSSELQVSKQ
jgi:predicted dehydrogenase